MTPAARVQAAIELLDTIIVSTRDNGPSADTLIADWFRTRRFAGSSDRRAIREHVYRAIRAFGEPPANGRVAMVGLARLDPNLALLFDGTNYGPPAIADDEPFAVPHPMPDWLGSLIDPGQHMALLERAPLDLRANRLKATREAMLIVFPDSRAIEHAPDGLRLDPPMAIENHSAYREGLIEVQDAGSQLVAFACRARPGMTVVDLCAGGGGKTLALAAAMAGQGRLVATDTDRGRLSQLQTRALCAGVKAEIRLLDGGRETGALSDLADSADVVLVDAPCSGSGTLRRNPEARWRLTPERLEKLVETQRHVLALAAPLVRPGCALVYAVCSLIADEGPDQVAHFLASSDGWTADDPFPDLGRESGVGRVLAPAQDKTDGFFVARLIRAC